MTFDATTSDQPTARTEGLGGNAGAYAPQYAMPNAAKREGAVLAGFRVFLARVVARGGTQASVDLSRVRNLPLGFLSALWTCHLTGVEVMLVNPQPNVRGMLWFRLYARDAGGAGWRMAVEPAFAVAGWTTEGLEKPC